MNISARTDCGDVNSIFPRRACSLGMAWEGRTRSAAAVDNCGAPARPSPSFHAAAADSIEVHGDTPDFYDAIRRVSRVDGPTHS